MAKNTIVIVILVLVAICSCLCGAFTIHWRNDNDIKSKMNARGIKKLDMVMKWEICSSAQTCKGKLSSVDRAIPYDIDITWSDPDDQGNYPNRQQLKCMNANKDFTPPDRARILASPGFGYSETYRGMTPLYNCVEPHWSDQPYHYVAFPMSIILIVIAVVLLTRQ